MSRKTTNTQQPRMIYYVPADGYVEGEGYRVSIVTEGERGHRPTGTWPCKASDVRPYFWGHDFKTATLAARQLNERLGISLNDETDILLYSMFGTRPSLRNETSKET